MILKIMILNVETIVIFKSRKQKKIRKKKLI
jgi:hypothetical protein